MKDYQPPLQKITENTFEAKKGIWRLRVTLSGESHPYLSLEIFDDTTSTLVKKYRTLGGPSKDWVYKKFQQFLDSDVLADYIDDGNRLRVI